MGEKGSHYVVSNQDGGWDVKRSGSQKVSYHADTKAAAENVAQEISRNQGTELVIHGKDGKIQRKDSHGNDDYPPKG